MKYVKYLIIVLFLCGMMYGAMGVYQQYATSVMTQKQRPAPAAMPPPSSSEPLGGSGTTPVQVPEKNPPSTKVEVAGLLKVELSESNSWSTILKLLALILGSAIGVKLINTTFKRFE